MSRSALWRQQANIVERHRIATETFQEALEEGRVSQSSYVCSTRKESKLEQKWLVPATRRCEFRNMIGSYFLTDVLNLSLGCIQKLTVSHIFCTI